MSGRRLFQRGHASVPIASLNAGASPMALRWLVTGGLILAVAAIGVVALSSATEDLAIWGKSDAVSQASELRPSPSTVGEALIDTALSKVQSAKAALSPSASGTSGLVPTELSDAEIAKLSPRLGLAESRLLEIYRLISVGSHRTALEKAEKLVVDHPNFQLAHLVHGDLLSLQVRTVRQLGDVPDTKAKAAAQQLAALRDESRRRLLALTERPPDGAVPSQFLALAPQSRHAIAVDASRSRMYLFENLSSAVSDDGLAPAPRFKLIGDYYISVGLSGIEKNVEGDKRTPLGVYYITSSLDPESLPDLYGVGALPINYPNPLDTKRGKTGSGIWLHGTPRQQFVRAPLASDGCVVLSNPDLEKLLDTVQTRTTPVVIASELNWVQPEALEQERRAFAATLEEWRRAKSEGSADALKAFYADEFEAGVSVPSIAKVQTSFGSTRSSAEVQLKDVSMLHWRDSQDTMVVTFGEVSKGKSQGVTRRQYWGREGGQWKIFSEGSA